MAAMVVLPSVSAAYGSSDDSALSASNTSVLSNDVFVDDPAQSNGDDNQAAEALADQLIRAYLAETRSAEPKPPPAAPASSTPDQPFLPLSLHGPPGGRAEARDCQIPERPRVSASPLVLLSLNDRGSLGAGVHPRVPLRLPVEDRSAARLSRRPTAPMLSLARPVHALHPRPLGKPGPLQILRADREPTRECAFSVAPPIVDAPAPPPVKAPAQHLLPGPAQALLAKQQAELENWMTPLPASRPFLRRDALASASSPNDEVPTMPTMPKTPPQEVQRGHISVHVPKPLADASTNTSALFGNAQQAAAAPFMPPPVLAAERPLFEQENEPVVAAPRPVGLPLSLLLPRTRPLAGPPAFACVLNVALDAGGLVVPTDHISETFTGPVSAPGKRHSPMFSVAGPVPAGAPRHDTGGPVPSPTTAGPRMSVARQYSSPSAQPTPRASLFGHAPTPTRAKARATSPPNYAAAAATSILEDSFTQLNSGDYHQRLMRRLEAISAQLSAVEGAALALEQL